MNYHRYPRVGLAHVSPFRLMHTQPNSALSLWGLAFEKALALVGALSPPIVRFPQKRPTTVARNTCCVNVACTFSRAQHPTRQQSPHWTVKGEHRAMLNWHTTHTPKPQHMSAIVRLFVSEEVTHHGSVAYMHPGRAPICSVLLLVAMNVIQYKKACKHGESVHRQV